MQTHTTQSEPAFFRIAEIVGNPKTDPPTKGILPIGKSTWWAWVRSGKAPQGVKLAPRTTAWRRADIAALVETLNAGDGVGQ